MWHALPSRERLLRSYRAPKGRDREQTEIRAGIAECGPSDARHRDCANRMRSTEIRFERAEADSGCHFLAWPFADFRSDDHGCRRNILGNGCHYDTR